MHTNSGRASARCAVQALIIAAFVCSTSVATAQEFGPVVRTGVVVDESGGAISDARFVVRSTHGAIVQNGITATDGTFEVRALPTRAYWLEVTAPRFAPRRLSLQIGLDSEPLRVVLGVAPLQSEVTVTAERGVVAETDRTPPLVTVRESSDYRNKPMPTIGQALEGAPGVLVQQSTYAQVSPFLRGFTGYHVLNLIDGVRLNNSTFRSGPNQYLALVDATQVERVEAMLGPASAQFGSDALGGAIHLLTPVVPFRTGAGRMVSGSARFSGASGDRSTGADAVLMLSGSQLAWTIGGVHRRLDDMRAGGGRESHHVLKRFFDLPEPLIADLTGSRQRDTGFTQSGFHTKVSARIGARQSLTAWFQRSDQDGVRGNKDLWGGLGRLRSDFDPQRLQLFYGRYETADIGGVDWISGTFSVNAQDDGSVRQGLRATDRIVRDDVRANAFGYSLQAGARAGSRHSLVFGGEVYDEHIDAFRDETDPRTGVVEQKRALYPNGSGYRTSGLFVQDVIDVWRSDGETKLSAHLGGRFTRVHVGTRAEENVTSLGQSLGVVDSERDYHDWTFNSGVNWQATTALTVHGVVGRGFRAPNLNDLGALGLNDLGYEVPAESTIDSGALIAASDAEGALSSGRAVASLSAERLFNYEIGLSVRWRRAHARVQAFDAELKAPIVRRTLVFPIDSAPSALGGTPVTVIPPTAAQLQQGVVSVATSFDPRAVKAFVNDGQARYQGVDAQLQLRIARQWSAEGSYSYLAGTDLNPTRFVRRLPPQHAHVALRYVPGGLVSLVEASALMNGAQERFSGGDLTDERIGAARRRADVADFFQGSLISALIDAGGDGVRGNADDVFTPTGETSSQIRDRVLPIGATINGVTVVDDNTRVPLFVRTPAFVTVNLRAALAVSRHLDVNLAVMNLFDRNYRVHGSGVDGPGVNAYAAVTVSY